MTSVGTACSVRYVQRLSGSYVCAPLARKGAVPSSVVLSGLVHREYDYHIIRHGRSCRFGHDSSYCSTTVTIQEVTFPPPSLKRDAGPGLHAGLA